MSVVSQLEGRPDSQTMISTHLLYRERLQRVESAPESVADRCVHTLLSSVAAPGHLCHILITRCPNPILENRIERFCWISPCSPHGRVSPRHTLRLAARPLVKEKSAVVRARKSSDEDVLIWLKHLVIRAPLALSHWTPTSAKQSHYCSHFTAGDTGAPGS